jgi:hypothetical protein
MGQPIVKEWGKALLFFFLAVVIGAILVMVFYPVNAEASIMSKSEATLARDYALPVMEMSWWDSFCYWTSRGSWRDLFWWRKY